MKRTLASCGLVLCILVGQYHCHDLDSTVISCYRTSGELEAVVAEGIASLRSTGALEAANYVRIWEEAGQVGASMYLSQDYPNLGSIGWNDRITSLRALNSESGTFHHDAGHLGTPYAFCCNQSVSNVGSTHNDKFSSVERT